jgi:hypothetical protein
MAVKRYKERIGSWTVIADIAADMQRMHVSHASRPLEIDSTIQPRLPSVHETLDTLDRKLEGLYSPNLRNSIELKCKQLQDRVMEDYKSTVKHMSSMQQIGVDDAQLQSKYSRDLEIWYRKAIQDILDACVAYKAGGSSVSYPRRQRRCASSSNL